MSSDPIRGELVIGGPSSLARTARAAFLSRYDNDHTRAAYMRSIDRFYRWCAGLDLDPMRAERAHLELFARQLERDGLAKSSVAGALNALAGLYKFAHLDGLIGANPMAYVRRPVIQRESTTNGLSRTEFADVLTAAEAHSSRAHALVCLLGLNGLRVSEACGIDVEHLGFDKGYPKADPDQGEPGTERVLRDPSLGGRLRDGHAAHSTAIPTKSTRGG